VTAQQLDSAQQAAEAQPVADESSGKAAGLVAVGALFTGLAKELDATREDLAATEQNLKESEQKASQAEKDAKAAEQKAADASSETDKAKAEADQANAEAEAAKAKTAVAADCAKAYLSALGGLFEGDDPAAQAPAVRDDLTRITADCKDALAAGG
jgi:chromosome segregation ATPase